MAKMNRRNMNPKAYQRMIASQMVTVRADRAIAPEWWANVAKEPREAFPAASAALLFGDAVNVEMSREDARILFRNACTLRGYPMSAPYPLVPAS